MSLFGSSRDRRRRTLAEDTTGQSLAASPAVSSKPAGKSERYSSAARRENRRHTTDFIPRRKLPLVLCYLASLIAIAGLLFGYAKSGAESLIALGLSPLLNAAQGGSLAGWFSSLLFGLAAIGSILVHSIRRHKVDDYRGRYRLWLWCAAAWMLMSIDATANLHQPFSQAMALVTNWSHDSSPAVWWIGVWGLILGVLALRLVLETRECRGAMLAVAAVSGLWMSALAIDYSWISVGEAAPLIAVACRLVGQVTLLLAIGIYARHVLLDSEGLLTVRVKKPRREKPAKQTKPSTAAASDDDSSKTTRVDAAHKVGDKPGGLHSHVQAVSRGTFAPNRSTSSGDDDDTDRDDERGSGYDRFDDDDDEEDSRGQEKLSKAERKRLRKMARRQQREER